MRTRRKIESKNHHLNSMFFLKGFLICPICKQKLYASYSRGYSKKYPYYHCKAPCNTRINAERLNTKYENALQKLRLLPEAVELFQYILKDCNTSAQKSLFRQERQQLERKIRDEELNLSRARKLFVSDILKLDDYSSFKREYQFNLNVLKKELIDIKTKLYKLDSKLLQINGPIVNILNSFSEMDISDKKHIVSLFPPYQVDFKNGNISLKPNDALSKILSK